MDSRDPGAGNRDLERMLNPVPGSRILDPVTRSAMSTLVIEGGHRLSGRVNVEGNKNAALPLMAACLLTDEPCTLEQRAAYRRRRGHGEAAGRSRRRGRRHWQHDAADSLPRGEEARARQRPGGAAARFGAAARAASGPDAAARSSRLLAAIFRRGAASGRTSKR